MQLFYTKYVKKIKTYSKTTKQLKTKFVDLN